MGRGWRVPSAPFSRNVNIPFDFGIPAQAGTHLRRVRMRDTFQPTVYLLASHRQGTLYVGVTSDLLRRLHQHREGLIDGFTKDYGVHRLVWFEQHGTMEHAITREKRIKKWNRAWKIALIEAANPDWRDLAVDWGFDPLSSHRIVRG
ncbi:putative endonuclease [Novosphingobium sp. CF614]|nr:putative endonuclease [Novosphingobium sp. CF614]